MPRVFDASRCLFQRAQELIPGGVNSPVRAFKAVGREPFIIRSAEGPRIEDVDGNTYLDYVCSWGAILLGHDAPAVREAIEQAVRSGTSFGIPSEKEIEFAELLQAALPSMELLRAVNSGTEATMSALRLARGATKRQHVIKFDGCYHGHADSFLVKAGSGVATLGIPGSPGVPEAISNLTITAEFNSQESVEQALSRLGPEQVAAIIVEPVPGNMGLLMPDLNFLKFLREVCDQHGIVLIFDEVMSGFRVHPQGAQGLFGITPDLTTLGKVIGGGMPLAVFGGKRELMEQLAPSGPVYQAGTLSGNPIAMAAGIAVLRELKQASIWDDLANLTGHLSAGLLSLAKSYSIPLTATACGGMFGFFFREQTVKNFREAQDADAPRFQEFFRGMLEKGIYLAPSPFEASFVTLAHKQSDIEQTLSAADQVFSSLQKK